MSKPAPPQQTMPTEPLQDAIDVWTWRLGASHAELALLIPLLSGDELARASRLACARDRDRFIVARARLRQILAGYLAVPPETMQFNYGKHGKPLVSRYHHAPSFNLTHSGDLAALAVSGCGAVGIDVEQVKPVAAEIAQRFFTEDENAVLARLKGRQRLEAFFRCWTRKEALVKANGKGLTGGLALFDVALARDAVSRPLHIGSKSGMRPRWSLFDLALDPGFAGALAVRKATSAPRLQYRKLSTTVSSSEPLAGPLSHTLLLAPVAGTRAAAPVRAPSSWS